jgi:hypothetical protein
MMALSGLALPKVRAVKDVQSVEVNGRQVVALAGDQVRADATVNGRHVKALLALRVDPSVGPEAPEAEHRAHLDAAPSPLVSGPIARVRRAANGAWAPGATPHPMA